MSSHSGRRHAWAWVLAAVASLCTGTVALAERTIIPIPEVIVDPNEGTTGGLLGVLLISNEDKSVHSILAPDIRYNDVTGIYPTVRFFDYPDANQKYFLAAGIGSKRGEDAEANYTARELYNGWLDLDTSARHEQDPFERFYGFGNHTPSSNESNYTSNEDGGRIFSGVNLPASFQGSVQTRIRHMRIAQGGVTSLQQVVDPSSGFSQINGVSGATIVGERFGITYDDRDAPDIPTEGVFANGAVEVVDKALGSSDSYINYGLEGKAFVPLRADKKFIVALHSALDYIQHGQNAPFYELNSVGGIHSLRGFGTHRYTDNNRFLLQGELRSNVYEREVFGVRAHLEVAPFLDLAKVFNSSRDFPVEDLHLVGGVGFRAVVVPQVVAFVDLGTAGGGPAAFTGIDYPF